MRTLEVPTNRMIQLPKHLFKPADKVALLTAGSVLIIRKLDVPAPSSLARRAPARPLSLHKVAREVSAYRRAKRAS